MPSIMHQVVKLSFFSLAGSPVHVCPVGSGDVLIGRPVGMTSYSVEKLKNGACWSDWQTSLVGSLMDTLHSLVAIDGIEDGVMGAGNSQLYIWYV